MIYGTVTSSHSHASPRTHIYLHSCLAESMHTDMYSVSISVSSQFLTDTAAGGKIRDKRLLDLHIALLIRL